MKWWDVSNFTQCLQKLGAHQQLSFLEIRTSETSTKKTRLSPLLPILTKSIFGSKTIKDDVKLPIAIRLKESGMVNSLLKESIAIDRTLNGRVGDGRLLLYAAYHDMGSVVDKMLEAGFDPHQLDQLIILEIGRSLIPTEISDKPPDWYNPLKGKADDEELKGMWQRFGSDEKKWHLNAVCWEMLPDVSGRIFEISSDSQHPENVGKRFTQRSVRTVQKTITKVIKSEERVGRTLEETVSKTVTYYEREFLEKLAGFEAGSKVLQTSASHLIASHLCAGELSPLMNGFAVPVQRPSATESLVQLDDAPSLSIRAVTCDDTVVRLPLEGQCQFRVQPKLRKRTKNTFGMWIRDDDKDYEEAVKKLAQGLREAADQRALGFKSKDFNWKAGWQGAQYNVAVQAFDGEFFSDSIRMFEALLGIKAGSTLADLKLEYHTRKEKFHGLSRADSMHQLMRIFWAIQSNRPRLAKTLLYRAKDPFLAAFFTSYCYNVEGKWEVGKFHPKTMSMVAEEYAEDMMKSLVQDGTDAVLDKYVFWTAESEGEVDFQRFMVDDAERQQNVLVRMSLSIASIGEDDLITNLDLAIASDSKMFMGEPFTAQFCTRLWRRPCNNGSFCDSYIPISPRFKWVNAVIGHFFFLVLHYVYMCWDIGMMHEIKERGGMAVTQVEIFFWVWACTYITNELHGILQETSIWDYFEKSGNTNDAITTMCLLTSAVARTATSMAYSSEAMILLMCGLSMGFLTSAFRLFHMLTVFEELGTMEIIAFRIVQRVSLTVVHIPSRYTVIRTYGLLTTLF
jgi:hypothetical protein